MSDAFTKYLIKIYLPSFIYLVKNILYCGGDNVIILAVDPGKARTGLAICDKTMFLASPLCVIEEYNRYRLADKIAEQAKLHKAELLVVGLPRNMDGSEGESAKSARELGDKLGQLTGLPVKMQDERCTTMIAHRYLSDNNVRGKKRKQTVDAAAATVILQTYLDYIKNMAGKES